MKIHEKVAKTIKKLRVQAGYTQEQLAELASLEYKYIQKIESKTPPNISVTTLEKIATAFKMKPSRLLALVEKK